MKTIKTRGVMPIFNMQLTAGAERIKNELAFIFDIAISEVEEITSRIGW